MYCGSRVFFCLGIIFFKSVEQLWDRCFIYELYIYVIHIWPGDVCIYPLTDFRWFRHQCLLVLHVMTPGPSPVSASPRRSVLYRFRHDRRVWQGNIHKLRDMCFMFVVTDLEYWNVNSKHWTTASIVKVQVTKDVMSVFQKSCGSCVLVEGFNRCCFYYPQTMAIYYVHVECLKDCVIHWLIGWSIDWLVDWLIDWLIHSFIDGLIGLSVLGWFVHFAQFWVYFTKARPRPEG